MTQIGQRAIIGSCVAAMCLSLVPIAHAKPVTGDISTLQYSTIMEQCGAAKRSLTIVAPEGHRQGEVTIARVNGIDLGTQSGWDQLADLTPEKARERGLGEAITIAVTEDGRAVFQNLEIGAYLVTGIGGDGKPSMQDMVVTVPTGEKTEWNCWPIIMAKPMPAPRTVEETPSKPPIPPIVISETPSRVTTPQTTQPPASNISKLSNTGAAVLGVIGFAAILSVLGTAVLLSRRANQTKGPRR